MNLNWPSLTIDDACDRLIDYRGKTPNKAESGIRLVTAKVVKGGRILDDRTEYITDAEYERWMTRGIPEKGDVLLTTEAPLGEVAILRTEEKIALAQRIILLRAKSGFLDSNYLLYALQTPLMQGRLNARASGTTVIGIKNRELRKVEIPTPPLRIQERIASILSAYDDLIENNRRRIQLLEQGARQLYKEWFVHLRFPGHEHVKIKDGVPKGWEKRTIADVCTAFEDGDWIESKDQGGDGFRLLQISNIGDNEFVETGNFRYITSETYRNLHCNEVVPGDILISRMPKPIGRAWYVYPQPWRMITAVDVTIARPNPELVDPFYYLYHLNSPAHIGRCELRATGATRARVTRKNMGALPILTPPMLIQGNFGEVASAINAQRFALTGQIDRLAKARDLLLSRLMNGEVVV